MNQDLQKCNVILISQSELPSSKIGSWTKLYKNYLEGNHAIDYIICPKPESKFTSVKYQYTSNNFIDKIKAKIFKKSHLSALSALKKILKNNENYIIQVVDNFKIVPDIVTLLRENGFQKNCKIQFCYHGFPPFLDKEKGVNFFQSIDEMILLTHDSYQAHLDYYTSLQCKFSVLPNGIDTSKFYPLDAFKKQKQKKALQLKSKNVFLWCSQDRPKKGLELVLEIWKKNSFPDSQLLVIGSTSNVNIPGVSFLGRIPNSDLPKYYQVSDVYLFSTLCQEGFGLSLIEALSCGCYCIASALGGVPEVLHYGKYGKLIVNPHSISEWENAINEYLILQDNPYKSPIDLYSFEKWRKSMNILIAEAKLRLTN